MLFVSVIFADHKTIASSDFDGAEITSLLHARYNSVEGFGMEDHADDTTGTRNGRLISRCVLYRFRVAHDGCLRTQLYSLAPYKDLRSPCRKQPHIEYIIQKNGSDDFSQFNI